MLRPAAGAAGGNTKHQEQETHVPDIPDDIMHTARTVAQTLLGELSRCMALEAIAKAILAERLRCAGIMKVQMERQLPAVAVKTFQLSAAIARKKAAHAYDDCECLGGMDPETGQQECSLEARGGDCLCQVAANMADEIARAIEATRFGSMKET
ncbi:hypothetical protein [Pleomorphomonas koreensis]|uniref:hypothetical protein n=1 Tax=Pleomorphomonas koreensis TaxID=257440 RepID=UPI0004236DEE|nr:hypothetical protein [Pleomorphomonas koreensis]